MLMCSSPGLMHTDFNKAQRTGVLHISILAAKEVDLFPLTLSLHNTPVAVTYH